MYNYPYGDNQQINLNWIISEIIALHKQLDPDYTAPSFTQIYPFSETQQLNLDWILTELKALKELAPPAPPLSSDDVLNDSTVSGDTVTDALDSLIDAISSLTTSDIANASLVLGDDVGDALNTLLNSILDEAKTRSKLNTKNLLIQNGEDSTTKADVTFTKNADGTITVNGTATATAFFEVTRNVDFGNSFITSATDEGQPINGYIMTTGIGGRSDIALEYNRNNKITAIKIASGATYDNLVIYPMIRYATDADSTFQKYIPTNDELNDALNSKVIQVTIPCSSAGTFNYTVPGLTSNHRLLRYQFLSGGTTETGDVIADIKTTTGANSLNVIISTVYTSGSVILLFGIPTVETATST